jgi:hypothetical protein
MKKTEICTGRAAAYISAFAGIEIFKIEYAPEGERVYFTAGSWTGKPTAHRARIYYTRGGDPYFLHRGQRLKLSDAIRNI